MIKLPLVIRLYCPVWSHAFLSFLPFPSLTFPYISLHFLSFLPFPDTHESSSTLLKSNESTNHSWAAGRQSHASCWSNSLKFPANFFPDSVIKIVTYETLFCVVCVHVCVCVCRWLLTATHSPSLFHPTRSALNSLFLWLFFQRMIFFLLFREQSLKRY